MRAGRRLGGAAIVAIAMTAACAAAPESAAPAGAGAGPAKAPGQPTTILGPAILRPGVADLSCGAGPAGLTQWRVDPIEQSLSLTPAQLGKLTALKDASDKAVKYLQESCPRNDPATPTGRVDAMEQRLEAMLEAVREVQPALQDFYLSLTDEQKARLNEYKPGPAVAARSAPAAVAEPPATQRVATTRAARAEIEPRFHHHRHWGFRLRLPWPL
jgi:hypothetical protein